jgi:hypothetical protein
LGFGALARRKRETHMSTNGALQRHARFPAALLGLLALIAR